MLSQNSLKVFIPKGTLDIAWRRHWLVQRQSRLHSTFGEWQSLGPLQRTVFESTYSEYASASRLPAALFPATLPPPIDASKSTSAAAAGEFIPSGLVAMLNLSLPFHPIRIITV